eukprot:2020467-Pleurochrysis_carterae.AAC.1
MPAVIEVVSTALVIRETICYGLVGNAGAVVVGLVIGEGGEVEGERARRESGRGVSVGAVKHYESESESPEKGCSTIVSAKSAAAAAQRSC